MKKLSNSDFQRKLSIALPGFRLIGDYINSKIKVTVSDSFENLFSSLPAELLKGKSPNIRSAVNKTKYFIFKSNLVHNNLYDYSLSTYTDAYSKVRIICKDHGVFEQAPYNHTRGHNCPKCAGFFTLKNFNVKVTHKYDYVWLNSCIKKNVISCTCYVVHCFNEEEEFIKIGITSVSIRKRFEDHSRMPYSYKVIGEIKGSPEFILNKEKSLHESLEVYKYTPSIAFKGYTECFSTLCIDSLNELS